METTAPIKPTHNSRKILYVVIGVSLILSIVLLLLFKNNILRTSHKSSITAIPSTPHTAALFFAPAGITITPNQTSYQVDIYANAGKNKVSGVQAEITYDRTLISNVKITPPTLSDSFFGGQGKQIILINKVNQTAGTITYAIAITPQATAATGRGLIGTLSFNAKGAVNTESAISFTPNTIVTQENESDSVLKSASPLYIKFSNTLPPAIPVTQN